jgi:hypothetical protein
MDYPWYIKLEKSTDLQQGDLIENCPVIIPPAVLNQEEDVEFEVQLLNAVIMTQSCDLASKHTELVLVCPYYTLGSFLNNLPPDQTSTPKARTKIMDNLRKGHFAAYHLLNKQDDIVPELMVVDFKNVYGVHLKTLTDITTQTDTRIRLLPPYREHLSQAFARYFMRVGLPMDIDV